MLSLEIIRDQETLSKISNNWNILLNSCKNRDVLYSYQWYKCWAKNYTPDGKMLIITVHNSDKLKAVMPLMRSEYHRFGMKINIIKSMTNMRSSKFDFITTDPSSNLLSIVMKKAFEDTNLKMMLLEKIPENSILFRNLKKACKINALKYIIRKEDGNYYIRLEETFDNYINGLKSKFRKNIRAAERKALHRGSLTLDQPKSNADLMDILERGFRVEYNCWKKKIGAAIMQNKNDKNFFCELAHECFNLGWINVSLLRNNKDDISFYFCISNFGFIHALAIGVDEQYKNIGPGILITKRILQEKFKDKKYKIWDFGSGSDRWKRDFSDNKKENYYKIFIFENDIRGNILFYLAKKYDAKNFIL